MSKETDFNEVGARLEKLGVSSPRPNTFDGSHSPPISTSHGQLSSDIQARIMAFQQKRQNNPSKKEAAPSKPLPPLPSAAIRPSSQGDVAAPLTIVAATS